MPTHHLYLVPGFFGFANLGDLAYFHHVRDVLLATLGERGLDVKIWPVETSPTASIRRRAAILLETIAATAGEGDDPIHVVGHSSGGLDARLLVTPGAALPTNHEVEPWAARVRSVVTVSTPHHGTPAAGFFASVLGQKLLEVLSLGTIYALRFGHVPIAALLKLGALTARLDEHVGFDHNVLDQIYGQLLADFTPERRETILGFLHEVRGDQALLPQITPEAMDVFNASTGDRPGVACGSVITWARAPGVGSTLAAGLDPYAQGTHALYSVMHRLSSRMKAVDLAPAQAAALVGAYGAVPPAASSDGMVPTHSQPWGEVIHATRADHLDVIGHYHDPQALPPHFDWLSSGSGFDRTRFLALWSDVAGFIAAAAAAAPAAASA
ncbi:esterase/lipase family protein [Vulgatibacter sp.]|uniref:esterase/lipase family protein n=1 Tax=Vulgatibacter sp. TaxID=1971226 RepID=UPI0035634F4F